MDEHADADEHVVGLRRRDRALRHRVGNRHRHRVLRRAEHLHRLLGVLDRHLVKEDRVRLHRQVRRDDRQERGEAVLVVGQRMGKRRLGGAAARPDDEIDMGDFVALADQRLADHELVYRGHEPFLPKLNITRRQALPA